MKNTYFGLTCVAIFLSLNLSAQLPPGSIAPNWTLTDINGNTHTLYDYLNQGKTVVLDFSATWCAPCWAYHNTGALETFYDEHGPDGSDESMVFFIEGDISTDMNDLLGLTPESQGDWVTGVPHPIIDLQNNTVMNAYAINYFPTIYKICPEGYVIYEVGQVPATTLANWIQSCTLEASLNSTTGTTCYGEEEGSATLNVTGGYGNISYLWSNGDNTPSLENVEAGTYYVTVTEGQGRQVQINNIVISGPLTAIEVSSFDIQDLLCFEDASGSIVIDADGGNGGLTFDWNNGDVGTNIQSLQAGLYTVTITDSEDCEVTESYFVDEPPLLEMEVDVLDDHCFQNQAEIEVTGDGGVEPYELETSGGSVFPGSLTVFNLGEGTYFLELIDAHDCVTSLEVSVDNIDGPDISMPVSPTVTCATGAAMLTPIVTNPGGGDLEFSWTTQDGEIVTGEDDLACLVGAPGTYILHVEDIDFGCDVQTAIQVFGSVEIPVIDAGADLVLSCGQNSVSPGSFINPTENLTIQWSTLDGHILSGVDLLNPVIDAAGTYHVLVVDQTNGCMSTDVLVVTDERVFPEAGIAFSAEELTVSFNASEGNGNTFQWDFGDGQTSDLPNPEHSYGFAGTYHVCLTVTNPCGSDAHCIDIIVQNAAAAIQVEWVVANVSCFGAQDGSVAVSAVGGSGVYQYDWLGPEGVLTGSVITSLGPGLYLLTVSDDLGNVTQLQVAIYEPPALEVQAITIPFNGNNGPGIDLTISGGTQGYTFHWSNGALTEDLMFLGTGTYQCTVTDANGCEFITEPIRIFNPRDMTIYRPGPQVFMEGNPNFQPIIIIVDSDVDVAHSLKVFNAFGQQLAGESWLGREHEVDIRMHPSGIYFVAVYENQMLLKTIPVALY